jgi:ABC-type transporter Mla subunit MlaD
VSDLTTAREALMAEAIGDLGKLLDRVETLVPTLEARQLELVQASADLAGQVNAYARRMEDITENMKSQAVKYMARRADELVRATVDTQTRAMEEAARTVFRSEVGPTLQRMVQPLQDVADMARRGARPWEWWLLHAATAVLSSALSWGMAAWLWLR